MQVVPVGVDIAKNVFQIHYVDSDTGEIANKPLKRAKFLETGPRDQSRQLSDVWRHELPLQRTDRSRLQTGSAVHFIVFFNATTLDARRRQPRAADAADRGGIDR